MEKLDFPKRQIRSFVRRGGRLTHRQSKAIEQYSQEVLLRTDAGTLSRDELFPIQAPCVFEIGFGMGHTLIQLASENPSNNYIGIDVHKPGIGHVLASMHEQHLQNIRLIDGDVVEVLEKVIPDDTFDMVLIFFPDPWHKSRHHKRRLIQAPFIKTLLPKMKTEARLHIATDWQPYAEHILTTLQAFPELANQSPDDAYISRPQTRPMTKYESRGMRLGHGVWDMIFTKA